MRSGDFGLFFYQATGSQPYPYQEKLATEPVQSRLVHVPTGCGKTAAAILRWLWRRGCDCGQSVWFVARSGDRRATFTFPQPSLLSRTPLMLNLRFFASAADCAIEPVFYAAWIIRFSAIY
jgi:hypothetical protein